MTSWQDEADKQLERLKDKPDLHEWLQSLVGKFQKVEDAILDVVTHINGKPFDPNKMDDPVRQRINEHIKHGKKPGDTDS